MADILTAKQRSYNMSRIRSKWTKQERIMHNHLKGRKVRHTMHPDIHGKPDILLRDSKILIFLDGCFWHKCPKCFTEPSSNRDFWIPKIEKNVKKDKETNRILKKEGWKVVRIWEHEIRDDLDSCLQKIESVSIPREIKAS